MSRPLYIGLMSGTSLDGVDGVVAELAAGRPAVLQHAWQPFDAGLRAELLALNAPAGHDELARAALAGNALARAYAAVVERLLEQSGLAREQIVAVGTHGQTVRHRPGAGDGIGYTTQLGNAALLAERCGIDVVADFRSRDVAAGGQGAPLAPGFHRAWFGRPGEVVAVLNIGGISNLSVLDNATTLGFDCGPGNALMDDWSQRHLGQPFDDEGRWAASGTVVDALLRALRAEPYLALPPPKSTGRDLFNPQWLAPFLPAGAAPADVQATLAEFTVACIVDDLQRHGAAARRLIVCGGGAYNRHLLARLAARLPGVTVETADAHGLPATQVEATAFAWLAQRFVERRAGNLPSVTGARGERVLGALYPR